MHDLEESRRLARLRVLLEGALELPVSEREAWLDRMCSGEPDLLHVVRDLLRRAEEGGAVAEFLGERA